MKIQELLGSHITLPSVLPLLTDEPSIFIVGDIKNQKENSAELVGTLHWAALTSGAFTLKVIIIDKRMEFSWKK